MCILYMHAAVKSEDPVIRATDILITKRVYYDSITR